MFNPYMLNFGSFKLSWQHLLKRWLCCSQKTRRWLAQIETQEEQTVKTRSRWRADGNRGWGYRNASIIGIGVLNIKGSKSYSIIEKWYRSEGVGDGTETKGVGLQETITLCERETQMEWMLRFQWCSVNRYIHLPVHMWPLPWTFAGSS